MMDVSPSQVHIRPMTLQDLPAVQTIDALSFPTPWPAESFRYELTRNPIAHLFVAETEDLQGYLVVIGMIVSWVVLDEMHIATIAVHPDYRRRGIGRRLLTHALVDAARGGVHTITLDVRQSNYPAQELYRRFGFELVGRRPGYYQDNKEDALLLTLRGENLQGYRKPQTSRVSMNLSTHSET